MNYVNLAENCENSVFTYSPKDREIEIKNRLNELKLEPHDPNNISINNIKRSFVRDKIEELLFTEKENWDILMYLIPKDGSPFPYTIKEWINEDFNTILGEYLSD